MVEIDSNIPGLLSAADTAMSQAVLKIAVNVTARAKALCPVDKGALRNSIMWKVETMQGGFNDRGGKQAGREIPVSPGKFEGYVGSALEYAVYQEFGTRKMRPQPYLRPAIALSNGRDKNEVKETIQKEMLLGPLKMNQKRYRFY